MKTVTADQECRIHIPDIRPNQKFVYDATHGGVVTLTPINAAAQERFPPGSLTSYITEESDEEMLAVLKGCSIAGPE